MDLFYGGGEIQMFTNLLESMGVDAITVSFMGLRRRIKHLDKVNFTDRFSDGTKILLDSGCHTINSAPDHQYSDEELKQIAAEYYAFVERNEERISIYTEFDALQLGQKWINERRLGNPKEIAVWHEEDGFDTLSKMAEQYPKIGVTGTSLGDRDLTPLLQRIARESTQLYGLGMSKPEQMAEIPWTAVTSTSWTSPVKFRDLIVWTGNELKRYPKKVREQGKKRHRTHFQRIGIDSDLIDADDNKELLKLSIWSWRQQVAHINGTKAPTTVATNPGFTPVSGNAEVDQENANNRGVQVSNEDLLENAPRQRPKRLIPGMTIETQQEPYVDADGARSSRDLKLVRTNSDSVLQCTGCYLAGKCPAFEPGAACVYDIPVEIRTKEQLASVHAALLEMQVRRVMLMHLAEQVDGGYADPNLSQEIDRMNRMIKIRHEMEQEGFSLTIKAQQQLSARSAEAGVLSRLFGSDAAQPVHQLPAPVPVKSAAEQLGLIEDVEVIDDAA